MQTSDTIDLYDSLVAAADAARRSELYEAMFHTLAAALHAAEALQDSDRVRAIERRAIEMHEWLSRSHPDHRIANQSAQRRGQTDVFTTLVVHAQSILSRLRAAAAVDRARAVARAHDPETGAAPHRTAGPGASDGPGSSPDGGTARYVSE
jgi:hypothetical protein